MRCACIAWTDWCRGYWCSPRIGPRPTDCVTSSLSASPALYTAFVRGQPAAEAGTVRSYLSTDAQLTRYSAADGEGGELAITHYHIVEAWQDVSLLQDQVGNGSTQSDSGPSSRTGAPYIGRPEVRTAASRASAVALQTDCAARRDAGLRASAVPPAAEVYRPLAAGISRFAQRLGRRGGGK